jgi:predicted Fe-S protein YdhL (DUF1289 family)
MISKVSSPCIGVCTLDPNWGQMCVGCHRFLVEINNWQYYDDDEKSQIIERIQTLRDEDESTYPDYR